MKTWIRRVLGLAVIIFIAAIVPMLLTWTFSLHHYLTYLIVVFVGYVMARAAIDPNQLVQDVELTPTEAFVRQPDDGYLYVDAEGQLV